VETAKSTNTNAPLPVLSKEEIEKRQKRAERFGIEDPVLTAMKRRERFGPVAPVDPKEARAERFGLNQENKKQTQDSAKTTSTANVALLSMTLDEVNLLKKKNSPKKVSTKKPNSNAKSTPIKQTTKTSTAPSKNTNSNTPLKNNQKGRGFQSKFQKQQGFQIGKRKRMSY